MAPALALGDVLRGLPRPPGWTWIALLVAALTWPINVYPPPSSNHLDISWLTALHVAAHEGLRFGSDFNFVYGPLGYLGFGTLFYDDTGLPASVVAGAIYLAGVALVARAACRSLGLVLGGLATFLVARIALFPMERVELLPAVLVAVAIVAVRRADGPLAPRTGAAIGLLAAFCTLVKISGGSLALAVVVVLCALPLLERERPWRQRLTLAWPPLAGAASGLIVLWLLAGEALSDLPRYLRNGVDFVLGNADAVAAASPGLGSEYVYAAIALVTLAAAVALDGRGMRAAPRLAVAALWLLLVYVSFRHGFTRHIPEHALLFFWPLLVVAAATLLRPARRSVALIACATLAVAIWNVADYTLTEVTTVSTAAVVRQVDFLVSSDQRHEMQADIRRRLRESYALPPALVERMRGETVHIDPQEAAVAWAFPELEWRPATVLQSYSTYTARLDDLNAGFLAGDRAPRYVLRESVTHDARNPRFESPAYMLELVCRYREVASTERWQLLERGSSRCGVAQPVSQQRVRFGERVAVPPAAQAIVVARFEDFDMPLSDRLRGLLLKRKTQWMVVRPGGVVRFLPGHAGSPHLMAMPPCVGWSQRLFDTEPYREVALGWLAGLASPTARQDASYTVRFERVPFRC